MEGLLVLLSDGPNGRRSGRIDAKGRRRSPGITLVGAGSPLVCEGQLGAATSSLQTSLPIAVAGVMALLLLTVLTYATLR